MKRALSSIGLVSALSLVVACGGEASSDELGSGAAALAVSDSGRDSVAAARSGTGFIVELEPGADAALDAWIAAHGARGRSFRFTHARAVDLASPSQVAALAALPGVVGVYPNRIVTAIGKPGGGGSVPTGEVLPAGVARVGAPQAWGVNSGANVGIAIVDTGIDLDHPDLAHRDECFTAFENSTCDDGNGHGTHVAGIAAALDNSIGVVGVAPSAVPYAVRVLDSSGSGTDATIIDGLEWVIEHAASVVPPIKVVNMSLGRPGALDDNPALRATVQNVVAAGITVVVAAGNDASTEISGQIPAAYPEVLAIGSTTALTGKGQTRGSCKNITIPGDSASLFTTDGIGVVVSAPGNEAENIVAGCFIQSLGILSLAPGGGTARMSGTSMASPTVAGVAALLVSKDETLTPSGVECRLARGASAIGTAPRNSPTTSYTFDTVREGVVSAPGALALKTCP